MTPGMEEAESEPRECLDLQALKETPLLAHQALRGHLDHLEEGMMDHLDHQGHLDLQDRHWMDLTEAHRLSVYLDHQDLLDLLDCLVSPLV